MVPAQDTQSGDLARRDDPPPARPGMPAVVSVRSLVRAGNFATVTLTDLDPGGGDGIRFYVLGYQRGFPHLVRSGTLANGARPRRSRRTSASRQGGTSSSSSTTA